MGCLKFENISNYRETKFPHLKIVDQELDFIAPTSGTYTIEFERIGNNSNCTFYVDDVEIREEYEVTLCLTTDYDAYRYSFQGQERDDEVKGEGNSYNYKYRMHDPRLGRFFAVDPLTRKYPQWTPYAFSGNIVIMDREFEGLEPQKGDPNYGQNIILAGPKITNYVMNPNTNPIYEKHDKPKLENFNWIAVHTKTFESFSEYLSNLKLENPNLKINNIHIQGHGTFNTIVGFTPDPNDKSFDVTTSQGGKEMLKPYDIENYLEAKEIGYDKYFEENPYYEDVAREKFKAIEALETIFNQVEDGGTVVFGNCYAGTITQYGNMFAAMSKLAGGRINIIMNVDATFVTESTVIDQALKTRKTFMILKAGESTPVSIRDAQNSGRIILSGTGDPIQYEKKKESESESEPSGCTGGSCSE